MLKPCRECGKEISDEAKACPHCGLAELVVNSERCSPTDSQHTFDYLQSQRGASAAAGKHASDGNSVTRKEVAEGCLGCLTLVIILAVGLALSDTVCGSGKNNTAAPTLNERARVTALCTQRIDKMYPDNPADIRRIAIDTCIDGCLSLGTCGTK